MDKLKCSLSLFYRFHNFLKLGKTSFDFLNLKILKKVDDQLNTTRKSII